MKHLLLVMVGGGLGAGARHLVSLMTLRMFGPGFPAGTLSVNVIGSLVMGLFIGWLVKHEAAGLQDVRYFFATGVLGGFTTFSAFSLDTSVLWERGDTHLALIYVLASVCLSIAAVFAGLALMRHAYS
ncbi:fluoride efflux transporter CrcB [Roseibium denhamense]|uniref:Fluoride-specific ion channel FluC n=1 Tax=Roseibium denhamense TaxID=76305 RepID=A0ABY1PKC4_9HYPH|nr:fluoride efflux transporter CrcB [Roseibium denhamense]MTI04700.1 fluoride efflux transporter CrcB [Roseibium denhamense]SMP33741.1 camphor resistance protein CrcB [Roseibium denhamense]